LGTIKASVLHTSGVGESQVDEWIGDLETLSNPTVGLLAHPGQIDIRVTAKASSIEEANQMIEVVVCQITDRLGDHIFGRDTDTLEKVTQAMLEKSKLRFCAAEYGLSGELNKRIKDMPALIQPVEMGADPIPPEHLLEKVTHLLGVTQAQVALGASYQPGPEKQTIHIVTVTSTGHQSIVRSYGGPPQQGLPYSVNTAIDYLRRSLSLSPSEGS
jgi:nicotinamide-nucleotide amidase